MIIVGLTGQSGSGKTTVAKRVVETLQNEGYKVMYTREPGGVGIAEKIRDIILDVNNTNLDPRSEALLYAASRRQHLKEIVWPGVDSGKLVICDRYLDSSLVYQGCARGLGIEKVYELNMNATDGYLPDLTLYLDVTPDVGLGRIRDNNRDVNRLDLEKKAFHEEVRNGYLKLCEMFPERIVKINAMGSIEEVYEEVRKAVFSRM